MTIPCPFNDSYSGGPSEDPNHQLADLFDHVADKHCPDANTSAVLRTAASKMRNPLPDPNRADDLSQYVK